MVLNYCMPHSGVMLIYIYIPFIIFLVLYPHHQFLLYDSTGVILSSFVGYGDDTVQNSSFDENVRIEWKWLYSCSVLYLRGSRQCIDREN